MTRLAAVLILASSARLAFAATAQVFSPPSKGLLVQTGNYTSFSNSTLKDKPTCKGKVFNRFIQIWLENTDFAVCSSLCSTLDADDDHPHTRPRPRRQFSSPSRSKACS